MSASMASEASKKSGSLASGPTLLTSPPPVASGKPLKTTDGVVLSDEPVQQVCPSPFCWGKGSNGKLGKFVALERPDLALGELYPPLSTVTWFSGALPEGDLRKNVEELFAANPWLGGSVRENPATGQVALWVPEKPLIGKYFEIVHSKEEQVPSKDAKDPAPFLVNSGRPGILQPDDPAFKVTAIRGPATFCVVVSLWSGLGDLFTYYSIFASLATGAPVHMEVERPADTAEAKLALVGGLGGAEEGRAKIQFLSSQEYRDSAQFHADFMRNQCKTAVLYVNETWLKEQEAHFLGNGRSEETPVTSNEILTSLLMREMKMDLAILPVDSRGSVPGLDNRHAGNHLASRYLLKEEFSEPTAIRRALNGYQEAWGTKTPSRTACLSLRRGSVTNGTEWLKKFTLGSAANSFGSAQQVLHAPIASFANIFLYAIIFAPRKGQLAVMVHAEDEIVRGLESHPAFAGPVFK